MCQTIYQLLHDWIKEERVNGLMDDEFINELN